MQLENIHSVMVTIVGNGCSDTSSNPNETVCISHCANTFGKDINIIILSSSMGE